MRLLSYFAMLWKPGAKFFSGFHNIAAYFVVDLFLEVYNTPPLPLDHPVQSMASQWVCFCGRRINVLIFVVDVIASTNIC
jgi:hypothetical protein